jgi:anti-sigma-K factor RskA
MTTPVMPDMPGSPEVNDPDLLAAEYVLGVLSGEDAARVAADPAMAAPIAAWQARLAPLARTLDPVVPPAALWARIDAATRSAEIIPLFRRLGVWRGLTAASLAIAAALAIVLVSRPMGPQPVVAALAPLSGPGVAFFARIDTKGDLIVVPVSPAAVPAGRDLELWALAEGAARPVSLGVLPASGARVVAARLPAGAQVLVSLEPAGGSPTGQPTGPVLYGGKLIR